LCFQNRSLAVPRFFFQIHDDADVRDAEGTVLHDLSAARVAAAQLAGAVLSERPQTLATGEPWRIDVEDERGLTVYSLHLHATPGAAAPAS
jgi:hypothetical protein